MSGCTDCPFKKRGVRVHGRGPKQARIAFVGEAPGKTEIVKRQPFVGISGSLLRQTLAQLGTNFDDCYVTNACMCYPGSDKRIPQEAINACHARLIEELESRDLDVIIALGAVAVKSLLKLPSITRVRGERHTLRLNGRTLVVIPTFHPAAALRNPDLFSDIVEDIRYALSGGDVSDIPVNYTTVITEQEALEFIHELRHMKAREICVDIETDRVGITNCNVLCIGVCHTPSEAVILDGACISDRVVAAWNDALRDSHHTWFGHNLQFDASRLRAALGMFIPIDDDTLLMHYALDERTGTHGLKDLAVRYLHVDNWEEDLRPYLKKSKSYANIPRDVLMHYNAFDVIYNYELYHMLLKDLRAEPAAMRLYRDLLLPASRVLADMQITGVTIDRQRVEELQRNSLERMETLKRNMAELVKMPKFNPRSVKQVKQVLYQIYDTPRFDQMPPAPIADGYEPKPANALDPYTTSEDQLRRIIHAGIEAAPFADLLLQYRKLQQLVGTYLKNFIPEADGLIHPGFLLHGTVTGRMSGSKPNLMNLSRDGPLRGLIVGREGSVILSVDYSQAELRTLAALSRSEKMLSIYREGRDLHNEAGRFVFGDTYDPKTHRRIVKTINFGIVYGRSASSIAQTFGLSEAQAEQIRDSIMSWLGVQRWIEEVQQFALENGYVETPLGRRRHFPLIVHSNVNNVLRQAVNAPIQATASDLILLSMIDLHPLLKQYDSIILFPVHDSIVLDVPISHLKDVAHLVQEVMLDVPSRVFDVDIPFKVDAEYGKSFAKQDLKPLEVV